MGILKELIENKIDRIADVISEVTGGKLDLVARTASLSLKCEVYQYRGDEIVIPIGTKSKPVGVSSTKADVIIFIDNENKERFFILTEDLKVLIKTNATKENLSFDIKQHDAMVITLNKSKIINYGKES